MEKCKIASKGIVMKFCIRVGVPIQILVTIGSGFFWGSGVEFPTFPLTYAVALKTLWHVAECDTLVFASVLRATVEARNSKFGTNMDPEGN